MKMAYQRTDFFYALMDKGYLNPDINAYADMIGRKVIIDQRAHMGIAPLSMDKPEAERYKARTTVERTNSELKDGYLPDKIYRRGCRARYDIELAILLTTLKKVRNVLLAREEARAAWPCPKTILSCPTLTESTQGFHRLGTQQPGLDDIALLSI